jgi:hypothetical protein
MKDGMNSPVIMNKQMTVLLKDENVASRRPVIPDDKWRNWAAPSHD